MVANIQESFPFYTPTPPAVKGIMRKAPLKIPQDEKTRRLNRENTFVLLITGTHEGDEYRFEREANEWKHYLHEETSIPAAQIDRFSARDMKKSQFLLRTKVFFDTVESVPGRYAVVIYEGHGLEGCMNQDKKENRVPYYDFAPLFASVPFVLVNTSCHSGSAVPFFKPYLHRGLVLAGCQADEICSDVFGEDVRKQFIEKHPYKPKELEHTELQHRIKQVNASSGGSKIKYENGQPVYVISDWGFVRHIPVREKPKEDDKYPTKFHPQRKGVNLDYLLYSRQDV